MPFQRSRFQNFRRLMSNSISLPFCDCIAIWVSSGFYRVHFCYFAIFVLPLQHYNIRLQERVSSFLCVAFLLDFVMFSCNYSLHSFSCNHLVLQITEFFFSQRYLFVYTCWCFAIKSSMSADKFLCFLPNTLCLCHSYCCMVVSQLGHYFHQCLLYFAAMEFFVQMLTFFWQYNR